jgi:serine/threonine-protein kinase
MRRQISTSGGSEPLWAASGKEVFYRRLAGDGDLMQVMAVDVATQPSFSAGSPRALFEAKSWSIDVTAPRYAVTPDGQHFLILKPSIVEPARQIHVVLNWFEELKRRVPVGAK